MSKLYNYRGVPVASEDRDFYDNYILTYHYDNTSQTWYSLIRVNQTKLDGTKQFPFHRYTGYEDMKPPRVLRQEEPWNLIINCGWSGIEIENSIVKRDVVANMGDQVCAITIDNHGTLGYTFGWEAGSGATYVENGIVSASTAFYPLLVDYNPFDIHSVAPEHQLNVPSQRQILGQWNNGDYAIITSEGRGYGNSTGFTLTRATEICQSLGLKFAFNLDGGGSTQTVIGNKTINTIYEGTDGRPVPSFIVFNGTDEFFIPT